MQKKTQREQVLEYIGKNGIITTRDAGLKLEIWDLQSIIRDLRNDGIDIKSEWVTNKRTKKQYKVYATKQKAINNYLLANA